MPAKPSQLELKLLCSDLLQDKLNAEDLKRALRFKDELAQIILADSKKWDWVRHAFESKNSQLYYLIHQQRGFFKTSNARGVRGQFYRAYQELIDPLQLPAEQHPAPALNANEKSQCFILRVGDHAFLRHVKDVYENLAHKYTSPGKQRAILQLFPDDAAYVASSIATHKHYTLQNCEKSSVQVPDGRSFSSMQSMAMYCKDDASVQAINEPIAATTRLKIYIAGHCCAGSDLIFSLELGDRTFGIHYKDLAQTLDGLFSRLYPNGKASNVEISMIACYAAQGYNNAGDSFAGKLIKELHSRGHDVYIKASIGARSAPLPFFNKTPYTKKLFMVQGDKLLVSEDIKQSWVYRVLQTVRKFADKYSMLTNAHKEMIANIITSIKGTDAYQNLDVQKKILADLNTLQTDIYNNRKLSSSFFQRNFKSAVEKDIAALIASYDQDIAQQNIKVRPA